MKTQKEIFEKILGSVNGQPVSFMALCRESGFSYRTVKRSLDLIEFAQRQENRIEVVRNGFRVVIKRPQKEVTVSSIPETQ